MNCLDSKKSKKAASTTLNAGEEVVTSSAQETISFGKKIGEKLQPNDVIALYGDLGAGKTTLVQGIGAGLGVGEFITSPTFILINEYQGRIPLYHVDLYRLADVSQIEDLGIEEYFTKGGVCVIEWAERLKDLMPKEHQSITIDMISEDKRRITWQY